MGSSYLLLLIIFMFGSTLTAHAVAISSTQNISRHSPANIFTKGLDLSPRLDVNIVDHDPLAHASKIVENPLRFPSLIIEPESVSSTRGQDLGHYAGYYGLNNTKGARMFYYLFESRGCKRKDPVIVWLSGGPGCSSSLAVFYENGPFSITDNLSLRWNPYGWDKVSNIIYIDQPIGTGFSYSTNLTDLRTTSEQAGENFYFFLQEFFNKHPQYAKNEFYITGESYAGHYIPAFAARVNQGNKNNEGVHINLKGISIGNGWTNPEIQTAATLDYALTMKLINQTQYNDLKGPVSTCQHKVQETCDGSNYNLTACAQTYRDCIIIIETIIDSNHDQNYYDIRKKRVGGLFYNFSSMDRFVMDPSVRKALGVDESVPFVSCSRAVFRAMLGDEMRNLEVYVPQLLQDGIKLLIYAGEYDLVCNWLGNYEWVTGMKWYGREMFLSARNAAFNVDRVSAGLVKSYGPLTFLKMYNAGHLVPLDQPKASLEMLRKWTQHIPL